MFFDNTLCSKCLGCGKLSLETKYFPGTYKCQNFVLAKTEEKSETHSNTDIRNKKVCEAINNIHVILGMKQVNISTGEQISINNMQN